MLCLLFPDGVFSFRSYAPALRLVTIAFHLNLIRFIYPVLLKTHKLRGACHSAMGLAEPSTMEAGFLSIFEPECQHYLDSLTA